jgi:hypothetical protein
VLNSGMLSTPSPSKGSCIVDTSCPHSCVFYRTVFGTQEFLKFVFFDFLNIYYGLCSMKIP